MKKFYLSLLMTIAILACESDERRASGKIFVQGKILGEIPEYVRYTFPVNGISYVHLNKDIQPDSLGNFNIELELEEPAIIELSLPDNTSGGIIAEPNMNYQIVFNTGLESKSFEISSKNKKGQEFYNELPNRSLFSGHFQNEAIKYNQEQNIKKIQNEINIQKEIEVKKMKDLLAQGHISNDFYQILKNDREYFYAGVLTSTALMKFLFDERQDTVTLFTPEVEQLWEKVYQTHPLNSSDLMKSVWGFYYLESYKNLSLVRSKENNEESKDENHQDLIIPTKQALTGDVKEYYYALYLFEQANFKNYEQELTTLFKDFKETYPKSGYLPFLEPEIQAIKAYHKKLERVTNEKINFIPESEKITSLHHLLSQLQHKKLYIDVWATWCKPCKEEFDKKVEIEAMLKEQGVEILYISIDEDKRKKRWQDMIKYYDLEGYHIRANKTLIQDLYKIYSANEKIYIPWYMLTNDKGEIVVPHASKPSEKMKLMEELKAI